ncbi:MAG: anion permease [Alphaproteobacteria bacterium]|nr:anion permease [Alphaproteobacteria bacterium]
MMTFITVTVIFFLAWTLGRNNLSNLFGPAIGTKMLPFWFGISIAGLFVIFGALISGTATTQNVSALGHITRLQEALALSISAGITMFLLSKLGVPASLTQTTTGAYIGWNMFHQSDIPLGLVSKTVLAWIYTPIISGIIAGLLFYILRQMLERFPIHILWRDHVIRIGLLCVGAFSAYSFGANNIGSLVGPYMNLGLFSKTVLFFGACIGIGFGFIFADRRVIKTVSTGMFPLSPAEAFIAVFSSALTLFLFSSIQLKLLLTALKLPSFPLVPVPLSCAVIGAIIGVAVSKGIAGLKFKIVGKVIFSWLTAPLGAGLLCIGILYLFRFGGI